MRRFCNRFLQNLETCTLCWMCTTFLKSWNWLMHTMKPILWGLHHVQGLNFHHLRQPDHHILLQGLKRCTHPTFLQLLRPSYSQSQWVQHSFRRFLLWLLWERGTLESCLFCQVPGMEAISITTTNFANIFCCPSTKSQGTLAFDSSFPHQR